MGNESTVCGDGAKISNWAILPAISNQAAGDVLSFFTNSSAYYTQDDRLQVLYSASGGTNTGSGVVVFRRFTLSHPALFTIGFLMTGFPPEITREFRGLRKMRLLAYTPESDG